MVTSPIHFNLLFIGGLLFFPSLQKDWGTRSPRGYLRSLQRQIVNWSTLKFAIAAAEISCAWFRHLSLMISARDETGQPMMIWLVVNHTLLIAGRTQHRDCLGTVSFIVMLSWRRNCFVETLNPPGFSRQTTVCSLPYLAAKFVYETAFFFSPLLFSSSLEDKGY